MTASGFHLDADYRRTSRKGRYVALLLLNGQSSIFPLRRGGQRCISRAHEHSGTNATSLHCAATGTNARDFVLSLSLVCLCMIPAAIVTCRDTTKPALHTALLVIGIILKDD